MRKNKAFDIAFVGLKNGQYQFDYEIDNAFFETFGTPEFQESRLTVHMILDKKENFLQLDFEITGDIKINCDRCGDLFDMDIWDAFTLLVKRANDPQIAQTENEDPHIAFISHHETVMNVAKWIYDFALLSIPMQRIHPEDEEGYSQCNPEALKKLEDLKEDKTKENNPIWKGLEQFRK
ncbi:MAG TPA: DUF177 domain-containing protein [Chitinophagaceae bacterium]|nr:DUF177 domain-containing protein [Chitinophagaceae bacterium]